MKRTRNALLAAALAGMVAGCSLPGLAQEPSRSLELTPQRPSHALEMARQLNDAFVEVADLVSPAVVVINVTENLSPDGENFYSMVPPDIQRRYGSRFFGRGGRALPRVIQGEGSGIVLTKDGYILTNNHVVENSDKIEVKFKNGKKAEAKIIGTDPDSDIAVIKVSGKDLVTATLGDSDKTRVGEFAIAIGAPFELSYSVTVGHVSAKGRDQLSDDPFADEDFIQTDASINPGNSGGPLVNLYGEVIGINSMIRGMNTGIGFAIPINLAKGVTDQLISNGKFVRSYIGVNISDLENALEQLKEQNVKLAPEVTDGVVITDILTNGPAAKSELKPNDVVVAVDGKPVRSTHELRRQITPHKPGQSVTLDVVRGAKHLAIRVLTGALPDAQQILAVAPPSPARSAVDPSVYGLTVQALTKEQADQFGVEISKGLIVVKVDPKSPAGGDLGLQVNDIITQVDSSKVTSQDQFLAALRASDPKNGLKVQYIRQGKPSLVVLREETN